MTNEWTKEIETLRARVACLEAALRDVYANHAGDPKSCGHDGYCRCGDEALRHAFKSGGTQSLDAVVSAAVAARVAAIRARVEALPRHAAMVAFNGDLPVVRLMPHPRAGTWLDSAATLSAIDATEGGAP